jgi:hypothetical protein
VSQPGDPLALERFRLLAQLYAARQRSEQVSSNLAGYLDDPLGFIDQCVVFRPGGGLTAYQREIIDSLVAKKRVAVRGPHGLGKTTTSALIILWFSLTREASGRDWKVVATAGGWRQLEHYLWPEIRKWAKRLNWEALERAPLDERSELMRLNLKLRHGEAFAAASDKPELIEGAHADSILYVFDESKAIIADTFDAAEGAFSGQEADEGLEAYALAMSTPGEPSGRFYQIHRRAPGLEDWHTRHVTLEEAIAARRVSRKWAEQRARQWGTTTAVYNNRVLGEFWSSDEDALVPLSWIEAAQERWQAWVEDGRPEQPAPHMIGVDVARTGQDKTVFAIREGFVIRELRTSHREDTMATTGRVKGLLEADPDSTAIVDVIGVGAGVLDRLRELKMRAEPFTASAGTKRRDASGELGFTNCLAGDAKVAPVGRLRRIYRSRYQGPLFHVKMASGDEFTATPNHQVLTPGGWAPVQSLHVGDKLCNAAGRDVPYAAGVEPEVDHMPAAIGDIYRAADVLFGSERMQPHAVNFHGDRPMGEVDVVTIDGQLDSLSPSCREHPEDEALVRPLLPQAGLQGQRLLSQPLRMGDRPGRVNAPFPDHGMLARAGSALFKGQPVKNQVVRFLHRQMPCFLGRPERDAALAEDAPYRVSLNAEGLFQRRHRLAFNVPVNKGSVINLHAHGEANRFGLRARLNAVLPQGGQEGGSVAPVDLAKGHEGLTGKVALDEVVSVDLTSSHESSFVYTLETTTGTYRSSSVTHRNCRSAAAWNLRELLDPARNAKLALPPDDELLGDLTSIHWKPMSGGKIQIESKDDIRKRIGRSTDRADAVIYAMWGNGVSWLDAYNVVVCDHCERGFIRKPDRDKCPYCKKVISEDLESESA